MMVDHAAFALVDRMEQLGLLQARRVTAVKDIPSLKLELDDVEGTIGAVLVQMGRSGEVDPQRLVLEAVVVGRLRDLMETRSGTEADKQRANDELAQAEQDLQQAKADLEHVGGSMSGDDSRMEALSTALAATRAVDHVSRRRTAKRLGTEADATLRERLGELKPWHGDGATLAGMAILSEDEIHGWKLAFANAQRRADQQSSELERITSDVSRLTVKRDAIGGTTAVVTDEDAGKTRTAREQAWAEHRRALDEASADSFEATLRRDDLVVSGRFMHATELANLHGTSQDLAFREEECRRATELMKPATEDQKALLAEVAAAIGRMSLPTDMSLVQLEAPCLTIRAGFTEMRTRETQAHLDAEIKEMEGAAHTVPHAITIVALLFDEAAALTLGRALEEALVVADRRPNLP